MPDRFPGYNVLAKRQTPSWNEQTRRVIDERLATPSTARFLSEAAFTTLEAVAAQIVPQPVGRAPVPVAGLVDTKLLRNRQDGYRVTGMPREREAWQRGLRALDVEAQAAHGQPFHILAALQQRSLLERMEQGDLHSDAWEGMPPKTFFKHRLVHDIVLAYWSHPTAWSEMGWGGPASPRGYVRMGYDERDPWEAAEAHDNPAAAEEKNRNV